jgi:hypothetical protein
MNDTPIFSERYGLTPSDAPITIRNDAPGWLRTAVIAFAYQVQIRPSYLRGIICRTLMEPPDYSKVKEFPDIDNEVKTLLTRVDWFQVYNIIEAIASWLASSEKPGLLDLFTQRMNQAFRLKGVGWQLVDGRIEIRGEESFEASVRTAITATQETGRPVAGRELHEALSDLSKRPSPDITGAIQHAMAALECVAKDVTGETKPTLGEWVKNNPSVFPQPIGGAIEKLWGYSSQYGRHVQEGKPADYIEAELVVGLAGALVLYLIKKAPAT